MGTTGSIVESKDKNIEMNIEDELPENTKEQRILKKRHSSQPQNFLPNSRLRNKVNLKFLKSFGFRHKY